MIGISGLDKAEVLMALYNGSHTQGLSWAGLPLARVTVDDCEDAIQKLKKQGKRIYFDYWNGHVLKVDLTDDEFDPRFYDRDCGEGAAFRAVERVRNRMKG